MEKDTARVIILTGTPGVGKTTVAKELATNLSAKILNVSEIVQKEKLITEIDEQRKTVVADMTKLKARIKSILNRMKGDIIIEGHYAYEVVPKIWNPYIFVLRRDPDDLETKLKERGYDDNKVSENVSAEVLDVCLIGSIKRFGKDRLDEIDVTHMDVIATVNEIMTVLNGENTSGVGKVDWIGKLEEDGRLEKFLSSLIRVEGVEYGHFEDDSET